MLFDRTDPEEASGFLSRQAARTAPLRRHLYRKAGLRNRRAVLDAGCGTGEITAEIAGLTPGKVTGLDCDGEMVRLAAGRHPGIDFLKADCASLPFGDGEFDLVTCHFLIMWLPDQVRALTEMARVLAPGGVALACAEPDYGGLVEYPEHPEFTEAVEEALAGKGADLRAGRKLGALFRAAGLGVQTGVSATVWEGDMLLDEIMARRELLGRDLQAVLGVERAGRVLAEELSRAGAGKMLMVPLFWALGFRLER